jgi:hypothetical protein
VEPVEVFLRVEGLDGIAEVDVGCLAHERHFDAVPGEESALETLGVVRADRDAEHLPDPFLHQRTQGFRPEQFEEPSGVVHHHLPACP